VAIPSERVSRIKRDQEQELAIKYCLDVCDIRLTDVDEVFLPGPRRSGLFCLTHRVLASAVADIYFRCTLPGRILFRGLNTLALKAVAPGGRFLAFERGMIHQQAHVAAAFYPSGFEKAAVLSVDHVGDLFTTVLARAEPGEITILKALQYPRSVGVLYTAVSQLLGFRKFEEQKLLDLSRCGGPSEYFDRLHKIIRPVSETEFWVDESCIRCEAPCYTDKMVDVLGPPRQTREPFSRRHKDLAYATQRVTEEVLCSLVRGLRSVAGADLTGLCLTGAVALNAPANRRIVDEGVFPQAFIPPAPHDTSISIGGALWLYYNVLRRPRTQVLTSPYLGRAYSADEIFAFAKSHPGLRVQAPTDVIDRAADALAEGKIVGWFQARSEFGTSGLGNRSILASPMLPEVARRVNVEIRLRDEFRSLAVAVPEDVASEWFDLPCPSPYKLLQAAPAHERADVLAPVLDPMGTVRVQTVSTEMNGRFCSLLRAFGERSGVPVLVNVAFSREGEPIVESPSDALEFFSTSSLDLLALDEHVVSRSV